MGRLVHLLLYTFISDKLILMGYPLHLPIHLYCRLIYGTSHNDPCNIILYIFTDPWMVDVFYVFFCIGAYFLFVSHMGLGSMGLLRAAEAAGPFLARRGLFHLWPIDDPGGENGVESNKGLELGWKP